MWYRAHSERKLAIRIIGVRSKPWCGALVELAFEDEQLRAVCLKRGRAEAALGPDVAHEIAKRVADIRAAETVRDLVVGVRLGDFEGREVMYLALCGGFEMILDANHVDNRMVRGGSVAWNDVSRVRVIGISRETKL